MDSLGFVDNLSVVKSTRLAGFDGVIARISNDGTGTDTGALAVYGSRSRNKNFHPMK